LGKFLTGLVDELVRFARHQFWLDQPVGEAGSESRRVHLESVARQTKKLPAGLDGPACPWELEPVWSLFLEFSQFRRPGFSGPAALCPADMVAWCQLTSRWPEPWEFDIVAKLDRAYRVAAAKREEQAPEVTDD